jgi:putative membrane protein
MRNLIRTTLAAGTAGALALAGVALAQQSSPSGPGGTGSSAGADKTVTGAPSAGPKLDKGLQSKLEKIHADNLAEVQLGQVAAQNAQSPDVKQFAEQMQTDHKRMDGKLQTIAQSEGASLEGKDFQKAQRDNQKEIQKLQSKTGKDFDKAYMSRMVKDHEGDLKAVKSATKDAEKGKHTELAALLQGAQTGMQGHLDHAKAVEKSLKAPSGAMGGTGSSTPAK